MFYLSSDFNNVMILQNKNGPLMNSDNCTNLAKYLRVKLIIKSESELSWRPSSNSHIEVNHDGLCYTIVWSEE